MASSTRHTSDSGWWTLRRVYVILMVTIFGGLVFTAYLNVYHGLVWAKFTASLFMAIRGGVSWAFDSIDPMIGGVVFLTVMLFLMIGGAYLALAQIYRGIRKHWF